MSCEPDTTDAAPIEMWGGVECTIHRCGDRWFSQIGRSGHADRPGDLDRIAELGIRRVRYPVLWEHVAPDGDLARADWSWPDARLRQLRSLGVRPIVGLVHHGSGPASTNLLDERFPEKLAEFARAVARRYPWVLDYTPINEPLTTARFSALYGLWYPHERSSAAFARALVNQCAGIRAAMRAIRATNPHARLVQTEDLGRITSTAALRYQAEFENERRWLTYDLLLGRVGREHPMRPFLLEGVREDELRIFEDDPCEPDMVGLSYYVTSDRFLDDRLHLHPECRHGGNGRHRYADIESVRVAESRLTGHEEILRSAWERYGRPLAVTEVQLAGPREEQLRWLAEAWNGAEAARRTGVPVVAVTAWALFGSYDWNSLLTRDDGYYENGAFDCRVAGGPPRATAVATMVRSLASGQGFEHPALSSEGWWRRPGRVCVGTEDGNGASSAHERGRPILIAGRHGTLGIAFARICEDRALRAVALGRDSLDIADPAAVTRAVEEHQPWAVVNTAGYVRVDDAEDDELRCFRENTHGATHLAIVCARLGIPLLTFSTDLVFSGLKGAPYLESDPTGPLNAYGRSKAEAERLVLAACPQALVVRTSAFFGPWDRANFLSHALECWRRGVAVEADDGQVVTPTYVPSLVHGCLDLLVDGESGLWHLSGRKALSWRELALALAECTGHPRELVVPPSSAARRARRPSYSALSSERGDILPDFEHCLERYLAERECQSNDEANRAA